MDSDNQNYSYGFWSGSTSSDKLEYRLLASVVLGDQSLKNHRLSFGLNREDTDFSQRGEVYPPYDPNQDQSSDTTGYVMEYVGQPVTGFTWTLSGRLDDYSDFDNAFTWQWAGSYQATDAVRFRGSLGTGSKTPTFTERYGFYEGQFIGNPNLKPESSTGWEIGVDTNWSEGENTLGLAYFNQDLKDEIDGFVFDPDTFFFTAQNKDSDSTRKGIETVFDARLSKSFTLVATYTYTDAREEDVLGLKVIEVRRPRHVASLSADYSFAQNRGNLNLNLDYSSSQLDNFFSPVTFNTERVTIDAYTVANLAGSWKLTKSLKLTGRISNLFDKVYEEILGFVRPGRAVFAGLQGRFDF